ncbi:unnamed protein product [Rotaria sp. Silwood1]|nr:unnamed protein product [Rotaria sp. Silwood1]CAF4873378.1 unnamed protein product [Rotaria sp. Silwood1]CAF4979327.1 unnamed protein product [Rotaria sp. Silwood1]
MAYLANMLYQSTLIHHSLTTCPFTMTRYLIVIADFLMANTIDQLLEYHNQNNYIQLCILTELLSRFRSCLDSIKHSASSYILAKVALA